MTQKNCKRRDKDQNRSISQDLYSNNIVNGSNNLDEERSGYHQSSRNGSLQSFESKHEKKHKSRRNSRRSRRRRNLAKKNSEELIESDSRKSIYIQNKGSNMQKNKRNYHYVNEYTNRTVHNIEQNDYVQVPVEWLEKHLDKNNSLQGENFLNNKDSSSIVPQSSRTGLRNQKKEFSKSSLGGNILAQIRGKCVKLRKIRKYKSKPKGKATRFKLSSLPMSQNCFTRNKTVVKDQEKAKGSIHCHSKESAHELPTKVRIPKLRKNTNPNRGKNNFDQLQDNNIYVCATNTIVESNKFQNCVKSTERVKNKEKLESVLPKEKNSKSIKSDQKGKVRHSTKSLELYKKIESRSDPLPKKNRVNEAQNQELSSSSKIFDKDHSNTYIRVVKASRKQAKSGVRNQHGDNINKEKDDSSFVDLVMHKKYQKSLTAKQSHLKSRKVPPPPPRRRTSHSPPPPPSYSNPTPTPTPPPHPHSPPPPPPPRLPNPHNPKLKQEIYSFQNQTQKYFREIDSPERLLKATNINKKEDKGGRIVLTENDYHVSSKVKVGILKSMKINTNLPQIKDLESPSKRSNINEATLPKITLKSQIHQGIQLKQLTPLNYEERIEKPTVLSQIMNENKIKRNKNTKKTSNGK